MKLLLTIVQDADASRLQGVLVENGFRATRLASTGGFLREGNTTLLIGVEDVRLTRLKSIIQEVCEKRVKAVSSSATLSEANDVYFDLPIDVTVGGAVMFVLEVEEFVKL